jgi:hypothetical protein
MKKIFLFPILIVWYLISKTWIGNISIFVSFPLLIVLHFDSETRMGITDLEGLILAFILIFASLIALVLLFLLNNYLYKIMSKTYTGLQKHLN